MLACGGGGGTNTTVVPPLPPDSAVTPIYAVQGSGNTSPLEGQLVTVVGIVSGDFQDDDADTQSDLGGFFLQEEVSDNDVQTSDGIFIYDGGIAGVDVRVGDKVNVAGTVQERFGETQINATMIETSGVGTVTAADLLLPQFNTTINSVGQVIADFERFEGMLVALPQELTVTDLFDLGRFGELSLSVDGRLRQFTNSNPPDVAGQAAHQRMNTLRRIVLDDGSSQQNISPARYLRPDAGNLPEFSIRLGDLTAGLSGVIRYSRGSGASGTEAYRLEPVAEPQFRSVNVRPEPPAVGGNVRVMSFNALNYFTTIDSAQNICGPGGNSGCRGADSIAEFDRQRQKTINAILMADIHIVGLMEIENNPVASLQSIVDGLNTASGTSDWSFIDTGTIGTDTIRVGLVYDTSVVTPVGQFALLDSKIDPRFLDSRNRKTLAQTFSAMANGGRVTIAVNHLKSKGSNCNSLGDPDLGDGQGNCNITRTNAAVALTDWLATDPTASGDADILIIGDMNAYPREDPVLTIVAAGYENVLAASAGTNAYTFVFRGESGALDHAFASASLLPQITAAGEWHINADEPPILDYNLDFGRDDTLFDPTNPFRASDHDPVVIGLNLTADQADRAR